MIFQIQNLDIDVINYRDGNTMEKQIQIIKHQEIINEEIFLLPQNKNKSCASFFALLGKITH